MEAKSRQRLKYFRGSELYQSASKHGRHIFLYSAMRELVCKGATLGKRGSETASQLQGRTARAFSGNSLVKTMEMMAVIQYILTATQCFGSQDYYKKSGMTILGLAGALFWRTSRHRQNGSSYVPKKILTWMLGEARGVLKATVCNRVTT